MSDEQPRPELPRFADLCSECQTGVMRLRHITYFTWLNQELVTVPNFPAWVCDVCGRREYDERAILWLNTLLSPETGRGQNGRKLLRKQRIGRSGPAKFKPPKDL
jgi:YgiT-type zinc finger domain-containing protein